MLSKLLLFFLLIAIAITLFINNQVPTLIAPKTVSPGTLVTVTSSINGKWICSVDHKVINKSLIFVMPSHEVTIIFNMKKITIQVTTPPDPFTILIRSWAPKDGRDIVANSLEAIAVRFPGEEIEDFINLTRLNNKTFIDNEWKSFFTHLSKYCQDNMSTADLQAHKDLWLRIAEALREKT